jgi:hypothetical protein
VTAGLLISVSSAHAAAPLDVDCDVLEATNDAVNVILRLVEPRAAAPTPSA